MRGEQVVLLGDLKGTKSYLLDPLPDRRKELENRLATLHRTFARRVLEYIDRSRSMHGYCFSDSVLVRWDNDIEASQFAPSFALELWGDVHRAGLPFRIFIDRAPGIPIEDDVGQAIYGVVGRYHHVVPVSMAVWSVFVAEESHFPDGVFIGKALAIELSNIDFGGKEYDAGPFSFFQLQEGA